MTRKPQLSPFDGVTFISLLNNNFFDKKNFFLYKIDFNQI